MNATEHRYQYLYNLTIYTEHVNLKQTSLAWYKRLKSLTSLVPLQSDSTRDTVDSVCDEQRLKGQSQLCGVYHL